MEGLLQRGHGSKEPGKNRKHTEIRRVEKTDGLEFNLQIGYL